MGKSVGQARAYRQRVRRISEKALLRDLLQEAENVADKRNVDGEQRTIAESEAMLEAMEIAGILQNYEKNVQTVEQQMAFLKAREIATDEALNWYYNAGYHFMNAELRGIEPYTAAKPDRNVKANIAAMDALMKPLDQNVMASRGFYDFPGGDFFQRYTDGTLVGSVFHDKAYTSLTVGNKPAFVADIRLTVLVPQGTPYVVGKVSSGEREITLGKGQTFRILSAEKKSDQYGEYLQLYADVV